MRRFRIGTVVIGTSLFFLLAVGGCGSVSQILGGGTSRATVNTPRVTVQPEAPVQPVFKAEPEGSAMSSLPSREAIADKRPPAAPVEGESALPGAMRISPPVNTAVERIYRDALITEDTVWRGEVVVEGSLTVAPQTTLTLEPGAVVRFRRTKTGEGDGPLLLVQGRLVARGSSESPVIFTSAHHSPLPGDWEGIILLGSEKKNVIENCRIEGAGVGIDSFFSTVTLRKVLLHDCGTGARFRDSILSIEGGTVSGCRNGIDLDDSEADVRETVLRDNIMGIMLRGGSLLMEGGEMVSNGVAGLRASSARLVISGALVERNGSGIVLQECEGRITASRVAGNREAGIHLVRSRLRISGNDISDNGAVGIRVEGGRDIAWGNAFSGNGRYDVENAGTGDFIAMANWWGNSFPYPDERLLRREKDPSRGRILVNPVLKARPLLATPNSVAK